MKKFLTFAALSAAASFPVHSFADENKIGLDIPGEFSANAALVSDYTFRGITQTDEGPAIQGGVDYNVDLNEEAGLYLGVWASNVDFNDSSEASSEFDWYGGITYEISDFSFDLGAIYYSYPNANSNLDYDFVEGAFAVGYDFDVASVAASINWSNENFGDSGKAEYYKLSAEAPLPKGFTIDAHVGRQNVQDNTAFANPDYTDWSIGLGYTIEGLDIKVQYIDTDIDKADCADGCDAKAIFSISKSF